MAGSRNIIVTELVANDTQYQQAINRAIQSNSNYQRSANRSVIESNRQMNASFAATARNVGSYGSAIAGAMAGIGAAAVISVQQVAQQAVEIENLSRLAAMSVEDFQAASYATRQYGIDMITLADMSKDAQDKLGDFIATGGGEMADFFEIVAPQVGLTAQALQSLSGPEILGAVKLAMDAANISAEEQIFYLESIANNASKLNPLLENNAAKLKELTGEYDDLGLAMSQTDIEMMREADRQISLITRTLSDSFSQGVVGASEQIKWLTDTLGDAAKYWGTVFDSWNDTPRTIDAVFVKLADALDKQAELQTKLEGMKEFGGVSVWDALTGGGTTKAEVRSELAELEAEIERLQTLRSEIEVGRNLPAKPVFTPQPGITDTPGKTTGKDKGDDDPYAQLNKELDALRTSYKTKEQLLLDNYTREQELLITGQLQNQISQDEAQQLSIDSLMRYEEEKAALVKSSNEQQLVDQRTATQSMVDSLTGDMQATDQLMQGFASGMSNAIVQACMTGEMSFAKFAESIIADMMRMFIQYQIVMPLMQSMGFMPAPAAGAPAVAAGVNHTGGIAGVADAGSRSVPLSVFAGAPRFHTGGIIGSEVPIIAQRGEGVFTPEQMKRLAPAGAGAAKVNIQIINNGQPAEVERTEQTQSGDTTQIKMYIRDVINGDINSGQGIDQTLRRRYPSLSRSGYG